MHLCWSMMTCIHLQKASQPMNIVTFSGGGSNVCQTKVKQPLLPFLTVKSTYGGQGVTQQNALHRRHFFSCIRIGNKKRGNQLPLRQLTVGTNKLAGRLGDVCCWRRKQWPMIRSHCTSLTPSIKKFTLKVTYIVWPDYPQLLTPILYQCGQRVKTKN